MTVIRAILIFAACIFCTQADLCAQVTPDSSAVPADTTRPSGRIGAVSDSAVTPAEKSPITVVPQQQDTTGQDSVKKKKERGKLNLNPKKATIFSAVLPGLGQVYNHDYWKVPLIYGGFAGCVYFIDYNHGQYKAFKTAFDDCETLDCETMMVDGQEFGPINLRKFRDDYRRYRDLMVIVTGLWYTLNIVDAYVSAHLKDFNVTDDFSFQARPSMVPALGSPTPAFGATLTFKLSR